jgi:hypothetical protein
MSANPEHNTPPKDRREAVYCSACDGVMCDTVRVNSNDCLEANHFFHDFCLLGSSDEPGPEAVAVCGINRCNNSCPIDQVVRLTSLRPGSLRRRMIP